MRLKTLAFTEMINASAQDQVGLTAKQKQSPLGIAGANNPLGVSKLD